MSADPMPWRAHKPPWMTAEQRARVDELDAMVHALEDDVEAARKEWVMARAAALLDNDHDWVTRESIELERTGSPRTTLDNVMPVTFYRCVKCGLVWAHPYNKVRDIYEAMAMAEVPPRCAP